MWMTRFGLASITAWMAAASSAVPSPTTPARPGATTTAGVGPAAPPPPDGVPHAPLSDRTRPSPAVGPGSGTRPAAWPVPDPWNAEANGWALTQAVVASVVELSAAGGVGAAGVPVNVGLARGAAPVT